MRFIWIFILFWSSVLAHENEKQKAMVVSWGDIIVGNFQGAARLDTPERIRQAVSIWKSHGIDQVFFRADSFRVLLFHKFSPHNDPKQKSIMGKVKVAWELDLLKVALDAMRKEGIRAYVWLTVLDEGCPPEVLYSDSTPFPWQSHFTRENPWYLVCDRSLTPNNRKYHWGFLEYAYPEVRKYMLQVIRAFSDRFNFDGVFLSLRSHSPPPSHADQFGFNEPVVLEFRKRYGRDILRESFDLEKWRELRGDFFTTFLQQVKNHLIGEGQKLAVGVQQGEYLGPPLGNMRIQWRRWVSEGIIDQLVVGHITEERARYPKRTQRVMGYLQSQENTLGLPHIEKALREKYAPLCVQYGVDLYTDPSRFYLSFSHASYGRGHQQMDVRKNLLVKLKEIPGLTGIMESYAGLMRH